MTEHDTSKPAQLYVWSDVDPDHEADFNLWYDREHMEERVRIPGFTGARRYRAVSGSARRYLALYRADNLGCFTTDAYRKAFTQQTSWSNLNFSRMSNTRRRVMSVAMEVGFGAGGNVAMVVLNKPEGAHGIDAERIHQLLNDIAQIDGVLHCQYLVPDETLSTPLPSEKTQGRVLAPAIVIDTTTEPAAEAALHQMRESLEVAVEDAQTFSLLWSLDQREFPA
ncbi:DUF4286 family protein [Litoreibacter albidus]|uniref:Uncharacterized protein n=1 Tax=Litoreibacter albidus TaxID=670155 RepID=A0A1H3CQS3_9RHOB|nr:DUF4286 family protein [Litoreibacter albidus]SDX56466.1 hypothetical protein SAMN04488001_3523 [Litoreibacter albidus]